MTELKNSLTSYFKEKIQRIKDLEVTYNTFKRVVESSESDEEAKNNLKKEFSIFNRGNDKFEDEFNKFIEQIEKGYTPTLPKLQINESKKIKIKTMKKQLNEVRRMQVLAGLITENEENETNDTDKALGTLFNPKKDEDGVEYFWDDNEVVSTIKDMGYKDPKEIMQEITTTTSPEDFLDNMRVKMGNDNLQFSDLTLDMFKQSITDDFDI